MRERACAHAGGALSPTPRMPLDLKDGRTVQRFVTVRRAPEPSDIWWENTRCYGSDIVKRRVLAWLGYAMLLGVAFAVQFLLALQAESNRREVQERRIRDGQGAVRTPPPPCLLCAACQAPLRLITAGQCAVHR